MLLAYLDLSDQGLDDFGRLQEPMEVFQNQQACLRFAPQLLSQAGGINLEIEDDGEGFQLETHDGLGIRVMQNRAGIIGGCLTIEPARPHGTLVRCTIQELNHDE